MQEQTYAQKNDTFAKNRMEKFEETTQRAHGENQVVLHKTDKWRSRGDSA